MKVHGAEDDFPVVCVGGSAGGLDAYTRLLQHLPADMGVAIVIVNHLRTVGTLLHEILPRYTAMPVELITDSLRIRPDHVFIIPAQRDLHEMPESAIASGCVDLALSPEDIAREIVRIAHATRAKPGDALASTVPVVAAATAKE